MIRFFARLAIAALADWLTWQISTPKMRFGRKTRKYRRELLEAMEAAAPLTEELYFLCTRVAEALAEWAEVNLEEEAS